MNVPCRAAVSEDCQIYADKDDSTYGGGTVICTPCFVHLMPYTRSGRALLGEQDQAILDCRNGVMPKPRTEPDPILDEAKRIFDEAIRIRRAS